MVSDDKAEKRDQTDPNVLDRPIPRVEARAFVESCRRRSISALSSCGRRHVVLEPAQYTIYDRNAFCNDSRHTPLGVGGQEAAFVGYRAGIVLFGIKHVASWIVRTGRVSAVHQSWV